MRKPAPRRATLPSNTVSVICSPVAGLRPMATVPSSMSVPLLRRNSLAAMTTLAASSPRKMAEPFVSSPSTDWLSLKEHSLYQTWEAPLWAPAPPRTAWPPAKVVWEIQALVLASIFRAPPSALLPSALLPVKVLVVITRERPPVR